MPTHGEHSALDLELRDVLRRLIRLAGALVGLTVAGTVATAVFEDVDAWRSFRWILDTMATIGSMPPPETLGAQITRVVVTVLGVGTMFYALVTVADFFVTGRLTGLRGRRLMNKQIASLSNHYIVCGFGRVGQRAVRELAPAGVDIVIIDPNPDLSEIADETGVPYIVARASEEDVLRDAGIERAKALLACSDSDPENVFIILAARELAPEITIVARAGGSFAQSKMSRAGADHVISPYHASGEQMALQALNPHVTRVAGIEAGLRVEEIEVTASCESVGHEIAELVGDLHQVAIIAVRREGDVDLHPAPDLRIAESDVVVAVGSPGQLERLERLLAPAERAGATG